MMDEITVRPAVVEDAADVLEIERGCAEVPHWNEGVWAQIFGRNSAQDRKLGVQPGLYGPERLCLVAEHKNEVVGFLVLSLVTNMAGGFAEIESVAVMEYARRHGVGRTLCEQASLSASLRGAESMQLEVRSANAAALSMYGALGFVEQGRRRGYYSDPPDDAVLMMSSLASSG
jgi:ribosomal-protein-alanine N-acetyltransferase